MKCLALPLLLIAAPLSAATIGEGETSAVLGRGDSLVFDIETWNFGVNAARLGLSIYPNQVSFRFFSAPLAPGATFSASLESADGATSIAFPGTQAFVPGVLSAGSYSGGAAMLDGALRFSEPEAIALFGAGFARIRLVNEGPEVSVGLPPYTLRRDLMLSLTGGPLSVGAVSTAVTLEEATPEPATWMPALISLGALMCRRRKGSRFGVKPWAPRTGFRANFPVFSMYLPSRKSL
jgi:hypothetical protein